MKTTVKDFILDHMTDANFEKLVDMFIMDGVWFHYDEIIEKISAYLNEQKDEEIRNDTFEKLNKIKEIPENYVVNFEGGLLIPAHIKYGSNNVEIDDQDDDLPFDSEVTLETDDPNEEDV